MYSYRIEQAIRAASILHKDQLRKGSMPLPYITHVVAVAMILTDYTEDEDVIISGLLHDTLEDTDYTPDEIQEDFGGRVREIVEFLTQPQSSDTKTYTWKEQKKHYAKKLKKAPEGALMVAAADKIHNMRAIVEEYFDDHFRFLKEFQGSLDERALMYQEISNVLNARISSDILQEFNSVYTEYKNFILDVKKSKEERENR